MNRGKQKDPYPYPLQFTKAYKTIHKTVHKTVYKTHPPLPTPVSLKEHLQSLVAEVADSRKGNSVTHAALGP